MPRYTIVTCGNNYPFRIKIFTVSYDNNHIKIFQSQIYHSDTFRYNDRSVTPSYQLRIIHCQLWEHSTSCWIFLHSWRYDAHLKVKELSRSLPARSRSPSPCLIPHFLGTVTWPVKWGSERLILLKKCRSLWWMTCLTWTVMSERSAMSLWETSAMLPITTETKTRLWCQSQLYVIHYTWHLQDESETNVTHQL